MGRTVGWHRTSLLRTPTVPLSSPGGFLRRTVIPPLHTNYSLYGDSQSNWPSRLPDNEPLPVLMNYFATRPHYSGLVCALTCRKVASSRPTALGMAHGRDLQLWVVGGPRSPHCELKLTRFGWTTA